MDIECALSIDYAQLYKFAGRVAGQPFQVVLAAVHGHALVVQRPGSYPLRKVGTVLGNTASLSRIFPAEFAARRLTDKSVLQFLTSSGNRNSGQGILKILCPLCTLGLLWVTYIKNFYHPCEKLHIISRLQCCSTNDNWAYFWHL